ncbi:hypothetical protein NFI96_029332 [Prochilodus magdalenae]|nr:hypothetical protein NFI96_029332 [Prochilodus magdalenae]
MFLVLQLLLLLALSVKTDGYFSYRVTECITSSSALTDMEFIDTYYFNKDPVVQFNSSVGVYVGFSEFGQRNAELWNNNSTSLQDEREMVNTHCNRSLKNDYLKVWEKEVKPKVRLTFDLQNSRGHPVMLMCSAYDFFPPAIDMYWLIDGKKVTTGVVSMEEMADGDWYYQVHSHLEHTPIPTEKISCVVEHASSKDPLIYDWGSTSSASEWTQFCVGFGFLCGGIISVIWSIRVTVRSRCHSGWRRLV